MSECLETASGSQAACPGDLLSCNATTMQCWALISVRMRLQAQVSKLTIDDVLEAEPELGRKLHAEISEGKFMP